MLHNSITIVFFVNNNHLSNVKTLQSIYKQNYPNINLVICNDNVYGFESERLFYNFENMRPENVKHIYYLENKYSFGELSSIKKICDKLFDSYLYIIHSGEFFTRASILQDSIDQMKQNREANIAVFGSELWTDDFEKIKEIIIPRDNIIEKNDGLKGYQNISDCHFLYRLSVVKSISFDDINRYKHFFEYVLAKTEINKMEVFQSCLNICKYSNSSMSTNFIVIPRKLRNQTLQNIEKILICNSDQRNSNDTDRLFNSNINLVEGKQKKGKGKLLMLHKLATLKNIKSCTVISVLLYIASGLFINIEMNVFTVIGFGMFAGATLVIGLILCLLAFNLYFKKNPQKLVR